MAGAKSAPTCPECQLWTTARQRVRGHTARLPPTDVRFGTRHLICDIDWAQAWLVTMEKKELPEVRCPHCNKLLAKGFPVMMEFRCPRCKKHFTLRAIEPQLKSEKTGAIRA